MQNQYVEPIYIYIYIAQVCMGFRAYILQRGKRSGWRVSEFIQIDNPTLQCMINFLIAQKVFVSRVSCEIHLAVS